MGYIMMSHIRNKILLPAAFFCAVGMGNAQSPYAEERGNRLPKNDSAGIIKYPVETGEPLFFPEDESAFARDRGFELGLSDFSRYDMPAQSKLAKEWKGLKIHQSDITGKLPAFRHWAITGFSDESVYRTLLARRTAALALIYRSGSLHFGTRLSDTRYETANATTQLGISGFVEYDFSPNWSVYVWGTFYDRNPYFSMAAFPFVETSSYGGWVEYDGKKTGIKLGVQRYYDSFQRQWKMEPIITPRIKIGKKIILELPVGPLVQKSAEGLLRKRSKRNRW